MTRLTNQPDDFPAEAVAGFADAFDRYVKATFGGVVRSTRTRQGKVALVVGGGSGHYPAFAGWVGQGFADGAVCGNIFSSPSASQAYSVCKAADRGAGVFIGFGNYAGDVLHFGQAVERLASDGIDARTLLVTDDIASGPPEEHQKRRGIAGDLPAFKITGAACEAGLDIDQVERVFNLANDRIRSFGVAFDGCTLPGADHPLFTVPAGRMGIGLGIHGEPGIDEVDLGSADDLAKTLVDGLLNDRPEGSGERVVAILNGLGGTKYEEMFVLWHGVQKHLRQAGIEIADSDVGEFVTSLDMAGVSLTLVWLTDELEKYWLAPCDTPAYRRGSVEPAERDDAALSKEPTAVEIGEAGSQPSRKAAALAASLLTAVADRLKQDEAELGDMDAIAGDGDHGSGMARGSRAARDAAADVVKRDAGAQTTLNAAGAAWSEGSGGTSGALWGAVLNAVGNLLGDQKAPDRDTLSGLLRAGLDAVTRLGGAQLGDKTMVDAMAPAADAYELAMAAGDEPIDAARKAVEAAEQGAESTRDMVAKLGRARPLGEKSRGTADPGAVSLSRVLSTIVDQLTS